MSEEQRMDRQTLDTILSIMTRCNYPQEFQIYFIAMELAERGYVTLTEKTEKLNDMREGSNMS